MPALLVRAVVLGLWQRGKVAENRCFRWGKAVLGVFASLDNPDKITDLSREISWLESCDPVSRDFRNDRADHVPNSGSERISMHVRMLALIALSGLAACGSASEMQMYPIDGPMSEVSPPPVIHAKARRADENSGRLKFWMPDGTKCDGTWTSVAPKVVTHKKGLSLSLGGGPGGNLATNVETVGGVNSGEIYAICKDGTRVQGNFVMGSGTTSGTGTATDNRGNVFKVLF